MRTNQIRAFKILFAVVIVAFWFLPGTAQVHQPVKWHFSAVQLNGSEATLILTAALDEGWHIYSQFIGNDGPLPTAVTFLPSNDYSLIGRVKEESEPIKSYDETFMMDIIWFSDAALFSQRVRLHSPCTVVKGKVEYMVCKDEMCLPPDEVEFAIVVKADKPRRKK